MECPNCRTELAGGQRFCMECGAPLAALCPSCSNLNPPSAKFCGDCGAKLGGSTMPAARLAPSREPKLPTSSAERRQLTVMFCDLMDSTPLSEQLDPEDLREVVRAYQQTSAEVIQRFDGHIAQLLGDGLLVYFGWPQAHDDDAQRAVQGGLGIIEAMDTLNTRLERDKGLRLGIRVGIHTGLVVVRAMANPA
jgi:class 3 adenylate cyclase